MLPVGVCCVGGNVSVVDGPKKSESGSSSNRSFKSVTGRELYTSITDQTFALNSNLPGLNRVHNDNGFDRLKYSE